MRNCFIAFGLILFLIGCGKKQEQTSTVDTFTKKSIVSIEPATGSPAYPDAKLVIVSPRDGQVLKNAKDSVRVVMQVTGIDLSVPTDADSTKGIAYSKQGQHVHVIVDDKPYMADYKNGQPFNIGVLTPGMHTIRAFPSYSWHESIKSKESFAAHTFYVGEKQNAKPEALNGPMLTYSRPKGIYTSNDANKVLLDFYLSNVQLSSDGYRVKLWIDGNVMSDIVKWQPYFITGLSKGKHTVKLQLVDAKGNGVPGAYNTASQEIEIQ
jgi:hypothetical protein